jgi:hypothetical protein
MSARIILLSFPLWTVPYIHSSSLSRSILSTTSRAHDTIRRLSCLCFLCRSTRASGYLFLLAGVHILGIFCCSGLGALLSELLGASFVVFDEVFGGECYCSWWTAKHIFKIFCRKESLISTFQPLLIDVILCDRCRAKQKKWLLF